MSDRTGMGQVKFKVRHNAVLLREFTVADMFRATGLNPESVRTELQRMKQEGLLTSHPHPDKPEKPGGRPVIYQLTDDPEARLALSESIEAFYPPLPPADRPTSRHYLWAQRLLNRAQTVDEPQRSQLLSEAEQALEMAYHAEGGSLAPEPVKAFLQYERARLAYLRGEHEEAERSFTALRGFFLSAQDETMVKRIDEFLLCLETWRRFAARMPGSAGEVAWARCLLDTLHENSYQTDSPLTSLSLRLLHHLSQTAGEEVRVLVYEVERAEAFHKVQESSIMDVDRARIVIADHDEVSLKDLREMLEALSHLVVGEARDGRRAVNLVRELRPDIVVMGIQMPVLDGINAARTLTEERIAPVLLLTAYFDKAEIERAKEAGVFAYLVKPFNESNLESAIEVALSRFAELRALDAEVERLEEALETRKLVDRAKGILMDAQGLTEVEAFRQIQQMSMEGQRPIVDIARAIITTHGV